MILARPLPHCDANSSIRRTNGGKIVDGSYKSEAREVANVEVQTQTAKSEQTSGDVAAVNN